MNNVVIVALYGRQRAGKTSVAKAVERLTGGKYHRLSFAQPIRDMLSAIVDPEHLSPTANKEVPIDVLGGKTIRDALKLLGTEWGRDLIHKDIWINALRSKIISEEYTHVIIDDLRLNNEYDWVKRNNGITVKVLRNTDEIADISHSSELDWPHWNADMYVLNDEIEQCAKDVINGVEYRINQ